jgi:5'-nucleotidase
MSLTSYTSDDFSVAAKFASKIAKIILKKGLPKGTLLNVNIPAVKKEKIKGVVATKQGKSYWADDYVLRLDPSKRKYYWLTGGMKKLDETIEFDQKAIDENYISVTPIYYDLTNYRAYEEIKKWNLKF